MSNELVTVLQMISTTVAVGISIAALVISHRRAHTLFAQQQRDSVLPRLRIIASYWLNLKNVLVTNCGVGTAVIDKVTFEKGGEQSHRTLAVLFQLPNNLGWDTWVEFHPEEPFLLRPGETARLIQLSERGLRFQGVEPKDALAILRSFYDDLVGTRITVEYSDVYNNEQPKYVTEICESSTSGYMPDESIGIGMH